MLNTEEAGIGLNFEFSEYEADAFIGPNFRLIEIPVRVGFGIRKDDIYPTSSTEKTSRPLTATMSSLEIAELTGKLHRNVMSDIRVMLEALGGGLLSFQHTYRHPQNGVEYPCFRLPRDLVFTLVTGYSIPLRKKVIDRWMELEQAVAEAAPAPFAIPQTLAQALQLAADQAKLIEDQEAKLLITTPKAELVDRTFKPRATR